MSGWIVIPNWEKFQHYHDRAPAWIKVYARLAQDDNWLSLSWADRGLLVSIWLAYAQSDGQVRTDFVRGSSGLRPRQDSLQRLSDAGFLEVSASKPLALARTRVETEKEKDPHTPKRRTRDGLKVTGWRMVRGSHGITHIPDPFGTDVPPIGRPL